MPLIVNSEIIEDAVFHKECAFVSQSLSAHVQLKDSRATDQWINRLAQQNVVSRVLLYQETRKIQRRFRRTRSILNRNANAAT